MTILLLFLGLINTVAYPTTAITTGLDYSVDHNGSGVSYKMSINGEAWFTGDEIAYYNEWTKKSTKDGSLKLDTQTSGSGSDATGVFKSTTLTWDGGRFVTTFKQYADAIVFEQAFPMGAKGTSPNSSVPYGARDDVSTFFPVFNGGKAKTDTVGFLSFAGDMTGSEYVYGKGMNQAGSIGMPSGVKGTGPVIFFDEAATTSAVVSSFSQFMAASSQYDKGQLSFGVQGSITEFPAGYSLSFVLSLGPKGGGVNAGMEAWGNKLLAVYGKDRAVTYRDYALNYLGYSTDNGAFYYYNTEGRQGSRHHTTHKGKDYQDTLIDVKKYADSEGIPYKYILLDSWWYYQGPPFFSSSAIRYKLL